jgi:hypothetical protein
MDMIFTLILLLVVALFVVGAALSRTAESRPGFDERREDQRFGVLR